MFPDAERPDWLRRRLDHRAIGVVYTPEREARGNYVPSVVGERYDAFAWFEQTRPLRPLHLEPDTGEEQHTSPWAV